MPASLYAYCRQGEHRPVKIGGGILLPTDRQTQDHLLCQDCEDILNHGGESWIADKLATWERTFPLYDILTKQPPEFDEGDMAVYFAVKNPEIKLGKLMHFALGMFWKASVHSWSGTETEPQIELGPYSESIRQWLKGENTFPKNIYLIVTIFRPPRAQITLTVPYEAARHEYRSFFMHVPGLLFMLAVGKTVDESLRLLCIHNNPAKPISVSDALTDQFEHLMVENVRRARRTESFLKSKAKADRERKK